MPHCPGCGAVLKPDLVLMGEQLPAKTWLEALQASKKCDLMIVAGSSLEVLPVAGLPMRALENGARLILINYSQTYLDVRADVVFHEDVAGILPLIVEQVTQTALKALRTCTLEVISAAHAAQTAVPTNPPIGGS